MADEPLSDSGTQNSNHSEQHTQAKAVSQPVPETSTQAVNGKATTPADSAAMSNGVASTSSNQATSDSSPHQSPSSAQPVPVNTASSSAQAAQPPTTATLNVPEGSRELEKDQASTKLAHTVSTATGVEKTKARKSKRAKKKSGPSLISKLLHTLVPCFGPPVKHHERDDDVQKPPPSTPAVLPSADVQEKPPVQAPESQPKLEPSLPPKSLPQDQPPASETALIPAPLQPVDVPPPSDDPAVVVPPTPTKTLPPEETAGLTSGAVQPPGSTGSSNRDSLHEIHRQGDSEVESDASTSFTDEEEGEVAQMEDPEDEEERLIANGGAGIPIGPDGVPRPLLPPLSAKHAGRKCLVLDLDETLVHSSFKSIQQADYVVPVEIEYHWHNVYVIKRPGVDNFLKKMGEIYEVVVFTASLSKYADPVLDKLDIHRVVSHRLFRESCYNHRGNYVKDLSQLGRPIADTIIIDNSPASYIFHPNNAVPVSSWFNDPHDTELTDLVPFLTDLARVDDVRGVLDGGL